MAKWRADDQDSHEPDGGFDYRCYGPICRIKKSILQQKVLYGVSGKAKLGKYCDCNRFFVWHAVAASSIAAALAVGSAAPETIVQAATRAKP
jgi:hypothetical protein